MTSDNLSAVDPDSDMKLVCQFFLLNFTFVEMFFFTQVAGYRVKKFFSFDSVFNVFFAFFKAK